MRTILTQINEVQCIHCNCKTKAQETKVRIGAEEYWNSKCLECNKNPYIKGEDNV